MLCWEEDCLEGPLLTPPSLLESFPQPPSAELFHYDSTNAVNWGMRGEAVGQQAGWGASGCRGAAAPLQAAPEMGSRPEGLRAEMGESPQPGRGLLVAVAHVSCFFVSHRVQGKMAPRRDCHLEVTPRGGPREVPLCAQTLLGRSFALSLPSSPSIPIPTAHPGTVGLPAELQLPAWVPSPRQQCLPGTRQRWVAVLMFPAHIHLWVTPGFAERVAEL